MKKRVFCVLLSLVMMLAAIPFSASADGSGLGLRPLAPGEAYKPMATSQSMVDMIKVFEGFRATPYWDVSQWSVGYGSACGYDINVKPDVTMTEPEAAALLMELLNNKYGKIVNNYCAKIRKQPSQQQFDALVDFTYNLGGGWTVDNCRLTRWLNNPTNDLDLVDAFGVWCRVGNSISYPIVMRRVREAIVFLRGEYSLPYRSTAFDSKVPVVSDADLPYYKAAIFQSAGGKFGSKSDTVRFFRVGAPYGSFPTPTWEGNELLGWNMIAINNRDLVKPSAITPNAVVRNNLEIQAVWKVPEVVPSPTDPPETTAPDVTEPETTVPETTVPETTEPEVTEPPAPEHVKLPFRDVREKDWFYEPVEFVYRNGYMSGTSADRFGPDYSMTRGMLVMVLYRIDGSPAVTDEERACFVDTQNAYYTDAVAWAKANGIVSGVSSNHFAPERRVTRQDAVAIFYQYCVNYLGKDGSASADLSKFVDTHRISGYAVGPMKWAVAMNLVSGTTAGSKLALNPRGNLTRAESATILKAMVCEILGEN